MEIEFLSEKYLQAVKRMCIEQIGFEAHVFDELYEYFRSTYHSEDKVLRESNRHLPIERLIRFDSNTIKNKKSYGVDVPVWFTNKQGGSFKIFLLAMDPLRGVNDHVVNKASWNTPFSIHQKTGNNYFPSIEKLAETYEVYVTDVYKLFYREEANSKAVSNESIDFISQPIHLEILQSELSIFQPNLILCLGKHAIRGLAQLNNWTPNHTIVSELHNYNFQGIPTFAIPHASGLASKWAQKFMRLNGFFDYSQKKYIIDAVEMIISYMNDRKNNI